MVKEVEFSTVYEILADNVDYRNNHDQELFIGELAEEGTALTVLTRLTLPSEILAKRKLFLYFNNIDFDNKLIESIKIGETDFDFCMKDTGEFTDKQVTFDLSRVLIIPRKVYNTQGSSEISIELYTYEANLTTEYGSKRLSVPYTINSDSKYKYDKSTDGVYELILIDFKPWSDTYVYDAGDIVEYNDTIIMSVIDNNTFTVTDQEWATSWITPDDSDLKNFSVGATTNKPARSITTNMLISRYAKYGIILNNLLSTNFKEYDDERSFELVSLLQSLREKAKFQLLNHKPIDALYSLQLLKLASSVSTDTTEVHNYNIKYTT